MHTLISSNLHHISFDSFTREFLTLEEMERQWEDLKFPNLRDFQRRRKPFTVNVEGIVGTGKSTFLRYFRVSQNYTFLT